MGMDQTWRQDHQPQTIKNLASLPERLRVARLAAQLEMGDLSDQFNRLFHVRLFLGWQILGPHFVKFVKNPGSRNFI